MLQVATFAVANASAATVLASKLQSAAADPSAFGSQLRAKGSLVFVESVEAPVVKTVVLPAPSPPVASPDVQAAPSPPAEPTIDDDGEGGGLFSTLAGSFGSWQIYEYVSVGGAALLLCCCCVGCICRRRLRNCCARICPCCPCSRDSEGARRRQLVQLSSSSLNAGSEHTEKQPRGGKKPKPKNEKKEKKEKAPKKEKREKPKRPKPHKGDPGPGPSPNPSPNPNPAPAPAPALTLTPAPAPTLTFTPTRRGRREYEAFLQAADDVRGRARPTVEEIGARVRRRRPPRGRAE